MCFYILIIIRKRNQDNNYIYNSSKRMKNLGINLVQAVKDLCIENKIFFNGRHKGKEILCSQIRE